jgi:hypothetical protein
MRCPDPGACALSGEKVPFALEEAPSRSRITGLLAGCHANSFVTACACTSSRGWFRWL